MVLNKKVIAFSTSAGTGSRTKLNIPKQFVTIDDIPLCFYPLIDLQNNTNVDEIAISIPDGWFQYVSTFSKYFGISKLKYIVFGGATIFDSISNILNEVNKTNKNYVVCLNDGDRYLYDDVLAVVFDEISNKQVNIIPYYSPYDNSFYQHDGKIEILNRDEVIISTTPQLYFSDDFTQMMDYAIETKQTNMYITHLVMKLGYGFSFVKVSNHNIKATYKDDIDVIKSIIHERKRCESNR